jgi:CheY-like chemotaxis protein
MRILVAEADSGVAKQYKLRLGDRGHIVIVTASGKDCLKTYNEKLQDIKLHSDPIDHVQPFDVVILNHKIPKLKGLEVAKKILAVNPTQRIIFASAYPKDILKDCLQQLKQSVEVLNKPFSKQALIDSVEDKYIYSALKELNVNIDDIKNANFRHEQLKEMLRILKKARRRNQHEESKS